MNILYSVVQQKWVKLLFCDGLKTKNTVFDWFTVAVMLRFSD